MKYTVVTTDQEDAALASIVSARNAERAQSDQPGDPLTEEDYFQARVHDVLQSYVQQQRSTVISGIAEKLRDADDAAIAQVAAAADAVVVSPNPVPLPPVHN